MPTRILPGAWRRARLPVPFAAGTACVLDLDCREAGSLAVRRRIFKVVRALANRPPRHWYHKIDSTLRGTISDQVLGLMRALSVRMAVLAPANPANGRTTKNGVHYVHGVPLARSGIGRDSSWPRKSSRVADILGELPGARKQVIALDVVERGHRHLRNILERPNDRPTVAIIDATAERHLRTIARAVCDLPLVVGSAGLARHLAALWVASGRGKKRAVPSCRSPHRIAPGTLIVAGSAAPETLRQNEEARKWIRGNVRLLTPQEVAGKLSSGMVGDITGMLASDMKKNLTGVGRLIVCGGRTASKVCNVLGVRELILLRTIAPGIGISLARGERDFLVVLKPGSFGPPDFFRKACRAMDTLLSSSCCGNGCSARNPNRNPTRFDV